MSPRKCDVTRSFSSVDCVFHCRLPLYLSGGHLEEGMMMMMMMMIMIMMMMMMFVQHCQSILSELPNAKPPLGVSLLSHLIVKMSLSLHLRPSLGVNY